jgi:hypothetical protein
MIAKKYFLLAGIFVLATFISYIPHLDYRYPLHVDEWYHVTVSKQIAETGGFSLDPFTGKAVFDDFEIGYHWLLALIHKITGLGFLIPTYLPAIFSIISVFFVYFLARRWGENAAFVSAFLTAILPSSVTIGGPSLLVPLNLTLIFTPLALIIVFNAKKIRDYIILSLINIYIILAHPPTAIPINLLLFFYFLLNIKTDRKKSKLIFICLMISLMLGLIRLASLVEISGYGILTYTFWVWLREIPGLFGYIQTVFFILGFYLLAKHGKKEDQTILLGIASFLMVIFFYNQTGWLPLFSYHRIYMSLFILMTLVAGYGISKIKSKPVLVVILSVIAVLSLQQHLSTPYYHIIDDNDYQNFVWIKDNTSPDAKALLDPWKARAFPAIVERRVFTVTPLGPNQEVLKINQKAYDFFNGNCTNTTFLIENNISIVYSPIKCQNNNLTEVKEDIYFLKQGLKS